jgi:hypothetical protein
MKQASLLVFVAMLVVAIPLCMHHASGQGGMMASAAGTAGNAAAGAAYLTEIPKAYRDWRLVSIAHEEGNLHSIGALLGNDTAYRAFRAGTLPYPDGSMLAALHYKDVLSDENDKVFGQAQSHVPGAATNVQFMVKDSKKYAATGGWGYGSFTPDGKSFTPAQMSTCFPCHLKATRDGVFSRYAP